MKLSLLASVLSSAACGETADNAEPIPVAIESQENIVSENGVLELTSGTLTVRSVFLIGASEEVPLIGPVTIDLSAPAQELPMTASIPPGAYSGLRIELAPASQGALTMDVDLRSTETEEAVRAISGLTMSGNNDFLEGTRVIDASSEVALHLTLSGMFFYLAPLTDAVEGVYDAGENHRDFLTMDLIGMFDLRVLP
jgi:hypothetical protein